MSKAGISLLLVTVALSLLLAPFSVEANSAPTRWSPGSSGLVVPSTTSEVKIERETLSFDLLSSRSVAEVRATYDLVNVAGRDVELDAIFIGLRGRSLILQKDGSTIPTRSLEESEVELPNQWLYPTHYVDPDSGREANIGAAAGDGSPGIWAFRLQLPAGAKATLVADYTTVLGHSTRNSNRDLAYVLGPAKSWADFGTLEVSAILPAGDRLATLPALDRIEEKDGVARYGAKFQGIPSEMFLATLVPGDATDSSAEGVTRSGRGFPRGQDALSLAVLGFPFLLAILLGASIARVLSRTNDGCQTVLMTIAIASLLTAVVSTALTVGLIILLGSNNYPDQMQGFGNSVVLAPLLAAATGALSTGFRRRH